MGLAHLFFSWNIIGTPIHAEVGTCLFEVEGDISFDTLFSDIEYPIVVADTGIIAGLTTDCHLFTPRAKLVMEVDGFQNGFTNNLLMSDGEFSEYRQTFICSPLILHRATDGDVFIAVAPILW